MTYPDKQENDFAGGCCAGCLSPFLLLLFLTYLDYSKYLVLITLVIVITYLMIKTIQERKLEKEKEFASVFPMVAEKYNSVMEVLNTKGNKVLIYKQSIINLYKKDKELYIKLKKLENEDKKVSKLIEELNHSLLTFNKEDKKLVSEKHLKNAKEKHCQYSKCIEEIGNAQDFINVKSELILNDSSSSENIEIIKETIASLEAKSKSLTYIQSNLPVFD